MSNGSLDKKTLSELISRGEALLRARDVVARSTWSYEVDSFLNSLGDVTVPNEISKLREPVTSGFAEHYTGVIVGYLKYLQKTHESK